MRNIPDFEREIIALKRKTGKSYTFIKNAHQVTEEQIDEIVDTFETEKHFTVIDPETRNIKWDDIVKRNDLAEHFIMAYHKELISHTKDIYETDVDFVKRQKELMCLLFDEKDSSHLSFVSLTIQTNWYSNREYNKLMMLVPRKSDFINGKLVYEYDGIAKIDKEKLDHYEMNVEIIDDKMILHAVNPLKIYPSSEYQVVKFGGIFIDQILENNNLDTKEKRSDEFHKWLKENRYK